MWSLRWAAQFSSLPLSLFLFPCLISYNKSICDIYCMPSQQITTLSDLSNNQLILQTLCAAWTLSGSIKSTAAGSSSVCRLALAWVLRCWQMMCWRTVIISGAGKGWALCCNNTVPLSKRRFPLPALVSQSLIFHHDVMEIWLFCQRCLNSMMIYRPLTRTAWR